jgi:hypothetical protein
MKKLFLLFVFVIVAGWMGWGQTNPAAQSLPYTQDFSALAWTSTTYPAGWQGWTISTAPGSSFNTAAPTADRALTASSTAATNSGNVHNYNGKIGYLNSGSLDLTVALAINTTGYTSISVSYDVMTIRNPYDGSTNTRINEVTLQYRVGATGTFTNLTGIEYQNNTTGQTGAVTTPQNSLTKTITLPAACDNQGVVQLRWASRQVSGGGSRPSFAVDNISASGTPVSTPSLITTPNSLSGFSYLFGSGPSAYQTFSLTGNNLSPASGDISVTCPADYEISLGTETFTNSLSLPYASGTLSSTNVNVRLISGLSVANYNNELVACAGGGASTVNLTCSGSVYPLPTSYSWTNASGGDWTVSSNWNPARTVTAPNDMLKFDGGYTVSVTNVPTQTIAQLSVTNNSNVTLQTGTAAVLTIAGGSGVDFSVTSGSKLNLSGDAAITISLGTGATGTVDGSMAISGVTTTTAHKLLGTDASSINFTSGSSFTAGAKITGNAFGTTNLNSIVFQSNSAYIHYSGSNPFGASTPSSVVVFQTGSLYKHRSDGAPSLSGRTFANFEIDTTGVSISATGTGLLTMDNLTTTNGTLNINLTGGVIIKGNIAVNGTSVLGFNPASANNITLSGTSLQTISGSGTLTIGANGNFVIGNAVTVDRNVTFGGTLTVNSPGVLSINENRNVTVTGNTTNNNTGGIVIKSSASGTGSFLDNGTISGTGTATVERYLTTDTWHYVSSPISNGTANIFLNDYLKTSDPTAASGWTDYITGTSSALDVARGYACWKPASNAGWAELFTGTLNTGTLAFTGDRTASDPYAGWHLAGNPYPSAIDLASAGINWGQFEQTAWFWDGANYTAYPTGGAYTHSQYVPTEQGFFVHIADTYTGSTSLTFTNTARLSNAESFLKAEPVLSDVILITASGDQNSYTDKVSVHFNPATTAGYDPGFDAYKLAGLSDAPQLYTMAGTTKVTCNDQPFSQRNMTIPMGFNCGLNGQYTLSAGSLETLEPQVVVTLKDKKTGSTQDLRTNPSYSFAYNTSDNADRFELLFYNPTFGIANVQDDPGAIRIYSSDNTICVVKSNADIRGNVVVYNLLGAEVFRANSITDLTSRFSLNVTPGYYLVRVVTDAASYNAKVYIN